MELLREFIRKIRTRECMSKPVYKSSRIALGKETMFVSKFCRAILQVSILVGFASVAMFGCSQGDTDGGSGVDTAENTFPQFVSDGGAGGSITISAPATIPTGSTTGFSVTALDSNGGPLAFIRIFCESELGIAILEPSSGGVAFESTGADGFMSGVLGGLTPGSFLLECRAPEGFNLVTRITIVVVGDVPGDFEGFPGAAGGNLGGGALQDLTDDDIFITTVTFTDAGGETTTGPIDTEFQCTAEAVRTTVAVAVSNESGQEFIATRVQFFIDDGAGSRTSSQAQSVRIGDGETGTVTGFLTDLGSVLNYAGTSFPVINGIYNVNVVISGESGQGAPVTVEGAVTVAFGFVNNCS